MNGTGKATHYFAGGNTAKGFYGLYDSAFHPLDRLFILLGGPVAEKSIMISEIAKDMLARGYDVEYLHNALAPDTLEGMIVTDLKIGLVDGSVPALPRSYVPGAIERNIDLGTTFDSQKISESKAMILSIADDIEKNREAAYLSFAEALRLHDKWEEIYIQHLHYDVVNRLTDELIELFFRNPRGMIAATTVHRFLGAATPNGAVDYVPNLTERMKKRYFIKGRPGTGKSTMLKKLAAAAQEKGYDVEIYRCGFDPDSLDMLIFPDLSISIFDSTAPHEYFPSRDGDEIIDMYELAITPGTDEMYQEQLKDIKAKYSQFMKNATELLAAAKASHDELKKIYTQATDFRKMNEIRTTLQHEIDQIAGITIFD